MKKENFNFKNWSWLQKYAMFALIFVLMAAGTLSLNSVELESNGAVTFGAPDVNGTWRLTLENDTLVRQRRVAGSWVNVDFAASVGGAITSETDPVFGASAAANVTNTKIGQWDNAFSWGNHANEGYLTALDLNGLSDVTANAASAGHLLYSSGGSWVSGAPVDAGFNSVALSGSYNDLSNKPGLQNILTVGSSATIGSNFSLTANVGTADVLFNSWDDFLINSNDLIVQANSQFTGSIDQSGSFKNNGNIETTGGDIIASPSNYFILGSNTTSGSWRFAVVSGTLQIQKRDASTWNTVAVFE